MVMKRCLIAPAQGFGDWIIVNPIVRILAKQYDEVGLVYYNYSFSFLKYMFTDLKNVKLQINVNTGLPNIEELKKFCDENCYDLINLMLPGKFINKKYELNLEKINMPFNRYIYNNIGFNWELDSQQFQIPIDDEKSKELHDSLNLPEKYIFLHEGDHPKINRVHFINKNITVFEPHRIENVFLYKYTIEHAEEIHVVNSGFYNFIDKLNIKNENYFFHKTRSCLLETKFLDPVLNKNWKIIDY